MAEWENEDVVFCGQNNNKVKTQGVSEGEGLIGLEALSDTHRLPDPWDYVMLEGALRHLECNASSAADGGLDSIRFVEWCQILLPIICSDIANFRLSNEATGSGTKSVAGLQGNQNVSCISVAQSGTLSIFPNSGIFRAASSSLCWT